MEVIRNLWYVAAWSTELAADKPIGRVIIGEPVVLWRKSDGTVVAMEDRCPHRHAPLSLGRLDGDTIRCMYHGLHFSSEGRCLSVPGMSNIPPNADARLIPVQERHSWIWVWLGDPARADPSLIPEAWGLDHPQWIMREGVIHDYAADYQLINDNLTDLSHLDFVHESTLATTASGAAWSTQTPRVRQLENGLTLDRWFTDHELFPGRPERVDSFNSYRYLLPGLFLMVTEVYPPGTAAACGMEKPDGLEPIFGRLEQQAVTPVGPGVTRYLFATGLDARFATPEMADGMLAVATAAFAEDRLMIESQQKIWDLTPQNRPKAFIGHDKAPSLFRRLISRRIAEERGKSEARADTLVAAE